MPRLEFWFDFASTYSYLSAMRIETLAEAAGVEVTWRPFLLGPILKAQGWSTSPFNIYPAKGRYMVRDISRIAAARGLEFTMPSSFPANSLHAARLALSGGTEDWTRQFSRAVFEAEFARGEDIGSQEGLARIIASLTGADDPEPMMARSRSEAIKSELRQQCDRAISLGIFGAPAFVAEDGELFWGDDRLESALRWRQSF